jgi:cobalt-zinc-cadmium efflux system outer membrane protein
VGLPLFSAHRQDPVIASKRAELRSIEAQRDSELRMHRSELQQMIADWETLKARIALYNDELLPLAHHRTQLALSSLQSATTGINPVLQAQAAEVDAQIQAIDLRAQLGHAWAFLSYLQDAGEQP